MKFEKEIYEASRLELCTWLSVPYDTDTNIESLRSDALIKLDEEREDDTLTYTFDELPDKAQNRVREGYTTLDYDWWEFVYEDMKTNVGPEQGCAIDTIHFDQYKHVTWNGWLDLQKVIELLFTTESEYVKREILLTFVADGVLASSIQVTSDYRRGMYLELEWSYLGDEEYVIDMADSPFNGAVVDDLYEALGGVAFSDEFEGMVREHVKEMSEKISKALSADEDYLTDDERIREMELVFDWEGNEVDVPADKVSATDEQQLLLELEGV